MESQEALFKRFISNQCTRHEIESLLAMFTDAGNETLLKDIILKKLEDEEDAPIPEDLDLFEKERAIYKALWSHLQQKRIFQLWRQVAAVACIFLCLSAGIYFMAQRHLPAADAGLQSGVIIPGSNKATLILSNGLKISLTSARNGELAKQSGMTISQTASGHVVYTAINSEAQTDDHKEEYNTIETPAGGQYQVNLPDGTQVWLNASSSIRYPVRFAVTERKLELKGEGYFEVAHDKTKPFRVTSANQEVEVLGTHFNVNAYTDEPTAKTTLLEGSVRIVNNSKVYKILRPGEQAALNGNSIIVSMGDTEQAIAWKNGDFAFDGTPLKTIMRQISRWYNVEISYQGTVADLEFGGSISRSKNIKEVLDVLEKTQGVHFKVDGRRIMVMP